MWALPLSAAFVSAVFAALVAWQWRDRRRPHQLTWSLALMTFAIASVAASIGLGQGWTPALFRIFYLFGAIVNVPLLAAGTIYLLASRPVGHVFAVLVSAGVILAIGAIVLARPQAQGLAMPGIPAASAVIPGTLARTLSRSFSYAGFVIVLGGALGSAWRLARRGGEELRRIAAGNLLIAAGTFIVASASVAVRFREGSVVAAIFSGGLLAGVTLMFSGFLTTNRRRR